MTASMGALAFTMKAKGSTSDMGGPEMAPQFNGGPDMAPQFNGGPDMAPKPPTLGAARETRAAPRPTADAQGAPAKPWHPSILRPAPGARRPGVRRAAPAPPPPCGSSPRA